MNLNSTVVQSSHHKYWVDLPDPEQSAYNIVEAYLRTVR